MVATLAAILDDVTDPSRVITNNIYLKLWSTITDYLLEVKYFRKIVTPQKPKGGVATTYPPPPPALYHSGDINLRVRQRVKMKMNLTE